MEKHVVRWPRCYFKVQRNPFQYRFQFQIAFQKWELHPGCRTPRSIDRKKKNMCIFISIYSRDRENKGRDFVIKLMYHRIMQMRHNNIAPVVSLLGKWNGVKRLFAPAEICSGVVSHWFIQLHPDQRNSSVKLPDEVIVCDPCTILRMFVLVGEWAANIHL